MLSPSITKDQTIIISGDTVQGFGCQHWIVLSVYAGVATIKALHLGDYPLNFTMSISYDVLQKKCTFISRPVSNEVSKQVDTKIKIGDTVEAVTNQKWQVLWIKNGVATLESVGGGEYPNGFRINTNYQAMALFAQRVASS